MSRPGFKGLIFAAVSAVCFGFSGPLAKSLIDAGLSPLQAVWTRLAGAALVLLVATALVRPSALAVPRHRLRFVAAYSLVGFAAVQAFYYGTIARLPVGVAVLLEYASPVLVLAWVRLARRTRLPRAAAVGAVLAVGGLACVVEVWRGVHLDGLGLVLGLGTAVCAAVYFLLSQEAGDDVHPLGALTWGLTGAAAVLTPPAAPWHLPWDLATADLVLGGWRLPAPAAVGWLVVVGTVIAYATGIAAVRALTAAVAATVASLEVLASILIAWVLLGEALGAPQLLGGALVLAGALLAQRTVAGRRAATVQDPVPGRREPVPGRRVALGRRAGVRARDGGQGPDGGGRRRTAAGSARIPPPGGRTPRSELPRISGLSRIGAGQVLVLGH